MLNILEDWNCLYRNEKFFYLERNRWPWRPDPVFDTTSFTHQQSVPDAVIASSHGVGYFDDRASKDWTDKYPRPLSQQTVPDIAKHTAYDEIINATLAEYRRNHKNISNAELPLEPRVVKEIRIGRNKLFISDVYGDGTSVILTLKNEKDAGISIVYQEFTECEEVNKNCQSYKESDTEYIKEIPDGTGTKTYSQTQDSANVACDGKKISQVRLRGPLGESVLIESYGTSESDAYSRVVARGIGGQLFELYDDLESGSNYIYGLSSTVDDTKEDWALSRGSFFLAATNTLPSFLRLTNNSIISSVPSNFEQLVLQGSFSSSRQSFATQYVTPNSAVLHEHVDGGKPYDRLVTSTSSTLTESITYNGSDVSVLASAGGSTKSYKITVDGSKYIEVASSGITIDADKMPVTIRGAGIDLDATTSVVRAINNVSTTAEEAVMLQGGASTSLKAER